nr:uncharacterized protein LOC128675323 isoform X2 [Plodia interpunctella]
MHRPSAVWSPWVRFPVRSNIYVIVLCIFFTSCTAKRASKNEFHVEFPNMEVNIGHHKNVPLKPRHRKDVKFELNSKVFSLLSKIFKINGRRDDVANIEIGPGVYKSPIVKYPEKFLEKRLKYLMELKKKKDAKKKG